ncbi:hypothetical protein [Streptomyces sp. WMMB303]|uniref:hypothetical protein n=1 Tax=Streptomyces sp. WMMB303 TaxID=3034154 RepID=UPI0023EE0635|nr:hypothetical protein [Streptomyces sp. WMMB303]MDF4250273.1 hypothetical protein [Streptomyces sp. WMMB303]
MPDGAAGRELLAGFHRAMLERDADSGRPVRPRREAVVHRSTDPRVLTVEQTGAGTLVPEGRTFRFPGLLVLRHAGGRLVQVRDYLDGLGMTHVGVSPGRGPERLDADAVAPREEPGR